MQQSNVYQVNIAFVGYASFLKYPNQDIINGGKEKEVKTDINYFKNC